jgi:hypothetical protein
VSPSPFPAAGGDGEQNGFGLLLVVPFFKMNPDEQLLLDLLAPIREQAKERVRAFAGNRLMRAKVEGRTITLEDVAEVVNEAAQVDRETRGRTPETPKQEPAEPEPVTFEAECEVK